VRVTSSTSHALHVVQCNTCQAVGGSSPAEQQPLQANNERLKSGAPDFETITQSLSWKSDEPKGKAFGPIRAAPGWKNFRRNFFAVAETLACIPYVHNVARFYVQLRGRAILMVNNEVVASMVCCPHLMPVVSSPGIHVCT
jgi:hypothetical protein